MSVVDPKSDSPKPAYRVLLVEDVDDVRSVFRMLLNSQGFDVIEFDNGPDAMEFCGNPDNCLPDAALVDAGLEGFNGIELGKYIRSQPQGGHVVLGTLTGNESQSCRQSAVQAGFDFHFVKPVRMKDVCSVLKSRLRGQPLAPELKKYLVSSHHRT